ncbi:MAG TPA: hypothetical protein VK449_04515 [Anaerolineales bacterium]|nr:hypothetical protein [Anaerolineales bacterium]
MANSWAAARGHLATAFWRAAASLTGFAVRHPLVARAVPVILLAAVAFFLGRAAGRLLPPF